MSVSSGQFGYVVSIEMTENMKLFLEKISEDRELAPGSQAWTAMLSWPKRAVRALN